MKRLLMAAVAITAMATIPSTANAQAVFNVSGSVNAVCSYSGGTIAFGVIATNADGTVTDESDGLLDGAAGLLLQRRGDNSRSHAHDAQQCHASGSELY